MSVEVHTEADRILVILGAAADGSWSRALGEQIAVHAAGLPVIVDVSGVLLRPDDLRALDSLLEGLGPAEVALCCSRLAGRQLLRRALRRRCSVVRSPDEVPAPSAADSPDTPVPVTRTA